MESGEPVSRPAAKAAGTVMQTLGMLLFLSSCCVCSFAGSWEGHEISRGVADTEGVLGLADYIKQENWGKVGMMLNVMFPMAGGFALATFGLGLQADRKGAGLGALLVAIICALIVVLGGMGIWSGESTLFAKVWHGLVSLMMWVLVGLSYVAYKDVRADPPEANVDILPADYKIPYSMYHDDPPEVRLAQEIANRKASLEAQMREIDELEEKLNQQKD